MSSPSLLPMLAIAALLSLVTAGVLLIAGQASPQLAAHVAFALGVLPLILAAMSYFVPVLTRSGAAGFATRWPPLLALAGGALAVFAFATDYSPAWLAVAATMGGLAALSLGLWILARVRAMLGPRHRGLDWYLAALGFLLLALLSIGLMPLYPAQRDALRLFHLHANLLGFVGLAAVGTLQVLLPTCQGKPDTGAALRLRRDIKWGAAGALLIAFGASLVPPNPLAMTGPVLALLGALLYCGVILRMLRAWQRLFGRTLLHWHGAAPSLVAATAGLLGLLVLGMAHGFGWLPARAAVGGYVIAFLLPLVSGAAAHLLPVWLRPGAQGPWHLELRKRLSRWGGLRGLLLLLIGLFVTALA